MKKQDLHQKVTEVERSFMESLKSNDNVLAAKRINLEDILDDPEIMGLLLHKAAPEYFSKNAGYVEDNESDREMVSCFFTTSAPSHGYFSVIFEK